MRRRREDQQRQDEADAMAEGQQRFNQQLQVIQAMPDGPEKNQLLAAIMSPLMQTGETVPAETPPDPEKVAKRAEFITNAGTPEGAQQAYDRIAPNLSFLPDDELQVFIEESGVSPELMISHIDSMIISDYDPEAVIERIKKKQAGYSASQRMSRQEADESALALAEKQKQLRDHRARLQRFAK